MTFTGWEMRPAEGGRNVVVRRSPDESSRMLRPPRSTRGRGSRVWGRAFAVAGGTVFFTNFSDQRGVPAAYGEEPVPVTPEGDLRHADFEVDARRSRLVCVQEDHSGEGEAAELYSSNPVVRERCGKGRGTGVAGWRVRLFLVPAVESRWVTSVLAELEPSEYAVGRDGVVGRGAGCRRAVDEGGRWPEEGGIDSTAGVVSRREAVFRFRPERMVEPLQVVRRAGDGGYSGDGGGVCPSAVGVRANCYGFVCPESAICAVNGEAFGACWRSTWKRVTVEPGYSRVLGDGPVRPEGRRPLRGIRGRGPDEAE